jgi:hypothetical protein
MHSAVDREMNTNYNTDLQLVHFILADAVEGLRCRLGPRPFGSIGDQGSRRFLGRRRAAREKGGRTVGGRARKG